MARDAPVAGGRHLTHVVLAAAFALAVWTGAAAPARAAAWPTPAEGTYVVPEFRFADGERMKDLRLHYVTLGTPHRNAAGHVDNAVLVLHGTGGDTSQFLRDQFAGVLFVSGGLLDASKYFIVITDGIGHGKSSKSATAFTRSFRTTAIATWCARSSGPSQCALISTRSLARRAGSRRVAFDAFAALAQGHEHR